ncbi:MAG: amidohydrolase family protein [Clostridiales Family XIII bacterium]|jgi:N-acyl-D-amino-acid deacylase|nr:amidohydrolase family protein [Clostridiales Family XIII bacterium]
MRGNATGPAAPAKEEGRCDLAIVNGKVADVIGNRISQKNVGIRGDKICCVTSGEIDASAVIDAAGLLVSPGFVDFHSHVDGNPYSAECLVRQGGTTTIGGERNLNSHVFRRIEQDGFLINQGFSISHSFVLRNAVGVSDNRPATEQEIRAMADLAARFLDHGAFGICFGLELIPGTSFEEILKLSAVAKSYERPILVHLRKDGWEALSCFDEILQAAALTGVSVQILQLLYMVGIGGAMSGALDIIEKARAEGLDITADSGLYNAFSVCIGTGVFDKGWEKEYSGASAQDILISSGVHVGEYCNEEMFQHLRESYPETLVSAFVCDKDAIEMPLKKDYVYISTNAADGPHYMNVGAPEVSGAFPRLLGRHVRERKNLPLIEAIKKITILPARRYGLTQIGSIETGQNADIVIFNPDTIIDKADFPDRGRPDAPPEGIEYVLVNGDIVVKGTELTENRHSGRLLKK